MGKEILINHLPYETRVAILEDGLTQDILVERERKKGIVGNIYKGRVQRVLPGMNAAFVDIGLERAGFLHLKNIVQKNQNHQNIEQILHEGQSILVQISKDPIGTKGARLTTEIAIPSRFLVYLPYANEIGVSIKIVSESVRQSLKELVISFQKGIGGGFIVRTAIEQADIWAIRADMQYLQRLWEMIFLKQQSVKIGLIYQDLPLYLKVLRDFILPNVDKVLIDDYQAFLKMQHFANNFLLEFGDLVHFYRGNLPIFDRYGVEEEIEKSLKRRVYLKSGGYLVIDQTEAMTTIDVNTGAFIGKLSQEDTVYRTNIEASYAIARELRLRNSGGIILLDFIDMTNKDHQKGVMEALLTALDSDKNKYTISPISPLGIIEMTRKRTRESLKQVMCDTCPTCMGRGYVKSIETTVYEIFRELMRESRAFSPDKLTIVAHPQIIDFIQEEESISFADLQVLLSIPIGLKTDFSFAIGQYAILLN